MRISYPSLDELIFKQALAELPQIMNADQRRAAVEEYVNTMTNVELIGLVTRALGEPGGNMLGARGRTRTCQEASPLSAATFIACGAPATCIVDNGDAHPYWMCEPCADHNVRNRGAIRWAPTKETA